MLAGLVGLRPEERRGAGVAFLTIFGILGAHTLLETARDALFLARLPATRLPWVYLAIAGFAVVLSLSPWRGRLRVSGRFSLAIVLVFCSLVTFAFWALGSSRDSRLLYALYVWSGIEGSLAPLEFWLVLTEKYNVAQAKRVFGVVGTGSLLGAVAGALAARLIVAGGSPSTLILVAAVVFAITGLGPALLLRRPTGEVSSSLAATWASSLRQTLEVGRSNPYVRGLGGLVLVSTVALTLADYVFKSTVARQVPAADLGAFFANLNVVLNTLGFFAQLVLSGFVFRVLGLHRALMLLPLLLGLGALGLAVGGGIAAALLMKGADGTLRYSVHRTGTELLYVPLPDGLRSRAKPFLDVMGQRGGQALASLYLLAEATLNRGDAATAAAAAALCAVWAVWAHDLRAHYLNLFRSALKEGVVQARADLPVLDLGSLEALFASLNSGEDREVLAAMDLLVEQGRGRLIPALILYHPSAVVVRKALQHFARSGRVDFLPIADRLATHGDPEIRAAALRARTAVKGDEDSLRRATDDESPFVKATALAGLVALQAATPAEREALRAMFEGDAAGRETTLAVARVIREEPSPVFADPLLRLVEVADLKVQVLVAEAMGRIGDDRFLPALLPLLGVRQTRQPAREAYLTYGAKGLLFLEEALQDPSLPQELRRHLPHTVSLFEPVEAARVLERRLLPEADGMVRFKILRALNRLGQRPEVRLDPTIVEQATRGTLEAALRLLHWRFVLERGAREEPWRKTDGHDLLTSLVADKEAHATERLFRLLSLRHRDEDMKGIHRGLSSSNSKVRAGSRELLENLLQPPLREGVSALVDDAPLQERLRRAAPLYTAAPLGYEALLARMLEESGESLRCVAAHLAGELGLQELRPRLESMRGVETGFFLVRVVDHALSLMAQGGRKQLHV